MGKWTYCTRSGIVRCDDKPIEEEDVLRILNTHEPMLTALKSVYKVFDGLCDYDGQPIANAERTWRKVEAAIAMAEGRGVKC